MSGLIAAPALTKLSANNFPTGVQPAFGEYVVFPAGKIIRLKAFSIQITTSAVAKNRVFLLLFNVSRNGAVGYNVTAATANLSTVSTTFEIQFSINTPASAVGVFSGNQIIARPMADVLSCYPTAPITGASLLATLDNSDAGDRWAFDRVLYEEYQP